MRACLAAGLLAAVCAALVARDAALGAARANDSLRAQVDIATVWTLGVAAWVAVFHAVIGLDSTVEFPFQWVAFAWPVVLLGVELAYVQHQTIEGEAQRAKGSLLFEMNGISGMALALGGLLSTNVGKGFAHAASPVLSAVILLCLAFVLPRPSVHAGSVSSIVLSAAQRACLTMCTGLLIGAVVMNMHGSQGKHWAEELHRSLLRAPAE